MEKRIYINNFSKDIAELKKIKLSTDRKDFLLSSNKRRVNINTVIKLAEILKGFYNSNILQVTVSPFQFPRDMNPWMRL